MSSTTTSSSSSSNDLLCRLKQSLDTIFDDRKQTSEKISKLFDIATMQPGACGSGEAPIPEAPAGPAESDLRPLVEMYVYSKETEYFKNVVSETREDEKRTDIFYTVTTPVYVVKAYNDIFNYDNVLAGQSVVDTWGSELLWDKTKKTWPGRFTAVLKRDILKKVIGYYDDESDSWIVPETDSPTGTAAGPTAAPTGAATSVPVAGFQADPVADGIPSGAALKGPDSPSPADPGATQVATKPAGDDTNDLLEEYLILGTFDSINLFDYIKNNYVSVLTPQIKKGSDNLYYMLQAISKDTRDVDKVSYKLSVFKTRDMAERAINGLDKSTKKK